MEALRKAVWMLISLLPEITKGFAVREWGQTGLKIMTFRLGKTMGPPAERL